MKMRIVVLSLAVAFAACKTTTAPDPGNPTILPSNGSAFTYQVDRPADSAHPALRLHELATIVGVAADSFNVERLSDTVNSFFTTNLEEYLRISNGDLWRVLRSCSCDSTPLPIATHRGYTPKDSATTPTKKNGVVYMGSVRWTSQYDGEETITAAGETFACSKVEEVITVTASSGDPRNPAETITSRRISWYSPTLHFFVKEQVVDPYSSSFTRTLVSYKVAK